LCFIARPYDQFSSPSPDVGESIRGDATATTAYALVLLGAVAKLAASGISTPKQLLTSLHSWQAGALRLWCFIARPYGRTI